MTRQSSDVYLHLAQVTRGDQRPAHCHWLTLCWSLMSLRVQYRHVRPTEFTAFNRFCLICDAVRRNESVFACLCLVYMNYGDCSKQGHVVSATESSVGAIHTGCKKCISGMSHARVYNYHILCIIYLDQSHTHES